jgi:hypothetical protein
MCTDRRDFLRLSAGIAGATLLGSSLAHAHDEAPEPWSHHSRTFNRKPFDDCDA